MSLDRCYSLPSQPEPPSDIMVAILCSDSSPRQCQGMPELADVTANSLEDWFSVSWKGGTGEMGWYIHPKGYMKTAWLCVGLAVKIAQ